VSLMSTFQIGSCKRENGQFYTDSHLATGARPPQ
jgi:hypothetical protein